MNIVNPINFLGRFGWRYIQINHNRFLAATHEHTAQRFLPAGAPAILSTGQAGLDLQSAAAVHVPTLIMATPSDPIHPFAFAQAFAGAIPGASFVKLRPKQLNDSPHIEEVNAQIFQFLDSVLL